MSTGKSPAVVASATVTVQPGPVQGCSCSLPHRLMNPTSEIAILHKGTKVAQLSYMPNDESSG